MLSEAHPQALEFPQELVRAGAATRCTPRSLREHARADKRRKILTRVKRVVPGRRPLDQPV